MVGSQVLLALLGRICTYKLDSHGGGEAAADQVVEGRLLASHLVKALKGTLLHHFS